ncbi:MAG: VOC family protein [Acidimicrobiales bacterium]|nr:VOC family protein [Acidimicrobiales bacterium]
MTGHDPFDELAMPVERQEPRSSFARELRAHLLERLGLDDEPPPTVQLPERKRTMSTTTPAPAATATTVVPYLAARDANGALDWYTEAFGAVEVMRVVGDDGRLGHAEFTIGDAHFYLSDEYPDIGVHSPQGLGGTATSLHLTVGDVDALFARAVAAGASSLGDPEDQPHGNRHGTLVDPYGHRWMLSQPVEDLSVADYAERARGSGFEVRAPDGDVAADIPGLAGGESIPVADRPGTGGGIWAAVFYRDALAGIRFLVDTFGFEEQLVVTGDDDRYVVHSELRWPEGGVVQVGSFDPDRPSHHGYADPADDPFIQRPGDQSLYVVTADPESVWERCGRAGIEVVSAPEEPDYAPGTMGFSVRDPEGNVWSFGSYGLGADT